MAPGLGPTLATASLALLESYEYIQLHTGSPGAAGTANIAGQSTRFLIEWDTPTSGGGVATVHPTADVTITGVAATETWTYFTAWSASSGGTFGASGVCTANAVTAGDNVTIDNESITFSYPLAS